MVQCVELKGQLETTVHPTCIVVGLPAGLAYILKRAPDYQNVGVNCQDIRRPKVVGVLYKMALPFQKWGSTLSKQKAPKTGGCAISLNS